MARKDRLYVVEWYSQENELVRRIVEARSWREAMFRVCDHPEWLHDQDVIGLRARCSNSKVWHYPKSIDDPIEDSYVK